MFGHLGFGIQALGIKVVVQDERGHTPWLEAKGFKRRVQDVGSGVIRVWGLGLSGCRVKD